MLSWELLVFIVCLVGAALYWRSALIIKERAERSARVRCDQLQLQFLDESIALRRVWLKRNHDGRLRFGRRYQFEFTATGFDRASGHVETLGNHIISVEVGAHRIQS